MRSHEQIITDAKGPTAMARAIGLDDAGLVHQWVRNNSIPAPYWADIAKNELASLDELAAAASSRRKPSGRQAKGRAA